MSTSQQPPMSRREARLAAQQASASSLESLIEPGADEHGTEARPTTDADGVGSAPEGHMAIGSAPVGSAPVGSAPAASTSTPPSAPAPAENRFRARDFRPPTERDHAVTTPPTFAVQPDDGPLEYRTAARSPSAASPSAASPSVASAPEPAVWMPVLPTAPASSMPAAESDPALEAPDHEEASSAAEPPVEERTMSRRELRARRSAVDPVVDEGVAAPLSRVEPPAALPGESALPQPSTATGSHWSVGAQATDDDPFENTFSRQVGSASASTNVLVLPEMPMAGLNGPVPGTGEIIITGMIDVPKSLSSTGSMSAVHESPDIDEIFEPGEREVPSTESTPVSAINAVSGHTATRAVMGGRKPRGNTVTTALVASTVVMAVAAVTIFVVAAANGLF